MRKSICKPNKIFALFLALLFIFGALPARAEPTVNSLDFVETITADAAGNGWSWAKSTKTLVLEGINLVVDECGAPAIKLPDSSKIILSGNNSVENLDGPGIYSEGSFTIEGAGELTIATVEWAGVYSENDVILDGGTVTINSVNGCGIIADGDFVIEDGALTINSMNGIAIITSEDFRAGGGMLNVNSDEGIFAVNDIIINGGILTLNVLGTGMAAINEIILSGGITDIQAYTNYAFGTAPYFGPEFTYTVFAGENEDAAVKINDPADEIFTENKYVYIVPFKTEGDGKFTVSGIVQSYNRNNPVKVRLLRGTAVKYEITMEAPPDGSERFTQPFEITGVTAGIYTMVVTKTSHTSFTVTNIQANGDIALTEHNREELQTLALLCGDIDGSGSINASDLAVLTNSQNYMKSASDAANPLADLNGDGNINASDLAILTNSLNYMKGGITIEF